MFSMLAIYLIILIFLLILFVLLTAIVFTFKLKALSLKEKNELEGTVTVKWLFFSHTFLIGEPGEKKYSPDESDMEDKGNEKVIETENRQDESVPEEIKIRDEGREAEYKIQVDESREPVKERPEEKTFAPEGEDRTWAEEKIRVEKKRGIFDRIKGKKSSARDVEVEEEDGMTIKEKLHWGLEAYKALRKPLFRLFSDMLNAIKIKYLKADLTFGLPDPADTGMLCGLIHAILGTIYSRCRRCSFSVCPVFMETLLDFHGSAEIRVKIYSLIFPFLKFIFNGKTLSFTYLIVKEKLRGSSKINS
ncbi:DUF2953 domain-containing protein [Methanosarcina mazei]|uniref:DUF2953 domain-containing protein n=1 Tax=Methanosarcina mazei TaxID=2209 RepID=A0A0F8H5H5_METMZ|nr:DUF2953 domain-containing protein [Methanosarcina mazei]KKG71871.1 hypothetical protein DU63_12465 [Methanosarcina mazei]